MEASGRGFFSNRHFAAGKPYGSELAAIEHDIRKPIMAPGDIAALCVMVRSIESRFDHGTLRLMFPSFPKRGKFRSATPGIFLPPDHRIDVVFRGKSICLPVARASNCRAPMTPQEVRISPRQHATLLHAGVHARFSHWHKLRVTLRRSSVSGGLSRPKSGSSLLSRER
jgi:hypothetical protein